MRTYGSRFPISDNTGRAAVTVVASFEQAAGVLGFDVECKKHMSVLILSKCQTSEVNILESVTRRNKELVGPSDILEPVTCWN
jgi:hypothetical protein